MRVVTGANLGGRGRRAVVGVAAMALLAGLSACGAVSSSSASGSGSPGSATSGSAAAGASATSPPSVAASGGGPSGGGPSSGAGGCVGGSAGATAGPSVTLGEADAGRTVCVTTGQQVAVRLQGRAGRAWRVGVEGTALVPVADGSATLPRGVQGATYRADHRGTARIVATRAACPSPRPGEIACMAVEQAWSVSVVVR